MGAPLALLAAVFALHAPPPTTHDLLPVFLGDRGPVYFVDGTHAPLTAHLRVFRERRTLADLLPRPLLRQASDWNLDGSTSRLVAPGLWAIAQPDGGICFWPTPERGWGYCVSTLLHGAAYPFVDARHSAVYGLVADDVVRVTVDGRPVRLRRNGFFARARRVGRVVVTAQDGARHVFGFFPCEVIDGTDFDHERIVRRPLDPRPDYCH